ncbi:DUF1028 domain-containing protein [Dokdonella sp.]|uniref:DUF1028 domain-containing protein n=1 Tax=Dokdonella sp. TaxID=2291710 RepID=UPI0035286549
MPFKFLPSQKCVLLLALFVTGNASATWSIIVDNPTTGTIAVAGASCSYLVYGIAEVVPGKGVVIVQAASNAQARTDAVKWLAEDVPPEKILARITAASSTYAPAEQQYALLLSDGTSPLAFTGDAVEGFKGSLGAPHVSVQANTMATNQVVPKTFAALHPANWNDDTAMADDVMQALAAGAAAGGDKRCQGTGSASAFVSLFRKTDNPNMPWLTLVIFGLEPGSQDAVALLDQRYRSWRKTGMADPSTRVFVVPAPVAVERAE